MQVLSASHMASDHLPSPTLTNPDMILPLDSDFPDTTSSSPRNYQLPPSPPSYPPPDGPGPMRKAVLNLFGNGHRSRDKEPDMTMLRGGDTDSRADGERSRQSQRTSMSSALASSPTLHDEYDLTSASDVVSDGADEETWEGFDGPANGEITSQYHGFKGHGFIADGVWEDKIVLSNGTTHTGPNGDMNESYSSAAMSIRAEQILANAKKRLTNMEGNLSRARSGLNSRPSSSMSSFASRNTEGISLYRIPGNSNAGFGPQKPVQPNQTLSSANSKGHLRVSSETAVPSSSLHARAAELQRDGVRASSALGSGSDFDEASEEQGSGASRNWFWTGLTRNGSYAGHYNNSLEPLHEDGPAPASFDSPASRGITPPSDEKSDNASSSQKASDVATFDAENPPANGLTRARSTNQMRDLQDQMQDLKGKISSLKQRARQDSMRRRSLQSLRAPSPFTAADQFYLGSLGRPEIHAARGSSVPPSSRLPQAQGDTLRPGSQEQQLVRSAEHSQEPTIIEESSEDGSLLHPRQHDADADEVFEEHIKPDVDPPAEEEIEFRQADSESIDIITVDEEKDSLYGDQDYHESLPMPIGERHEDRPDAFDYEHFFLHSGIGAVSRGDRSRSSSNSSMYSVETTKPATATVEEPQEIEDSADGTPKVGQGNGSYNPNGHYRKDSAGSISTVATFATATEGRASEADEDEWIHQRPRAGVFEPDFSIQHQLATSPVEAPPAEVPRRIRSMRGATVRRFPVNASPTPPSTTPGRSNSLSEPARNVGRAISPFPSSELFSILAATSPSNQGEPLQLSGSDKELVERLVTSLSNVCSQLHTAGIEGSKYEGRAWRRRLDAARRVLDGEINGEAF